MSLSANVGSVSGRAFYRWHVVAVFAVYLAGASPAEAIAVPLRSDKFIGAAGCKSSSCHGGAGEKRSQYLTWVKQDFHSRAYAVLVNARSARMAETLALPAAQTSARCTVCHSPLQSVAPSRLTKTAQPDEGVSCENCHGAAGQWLRGHTRRDWTFATCVGAGMRDLRNFYVRANTCVACHQNLDADLLAAGHPELTFELDGQSVAEPKHWRDEDPWSGPRAWLVGQAVALREMSWALTKTDTPDLEATARWHALVWLLAKSTAQVTPSLPVITLPDGMVNHELFANLQGQADRLARQAATIAWTEQLTINVLRALVAPDSVFTAPTAAPETLFPRAQGLVLALDRLVRASEDRAGTAARSALAVLFEDVRARPDFQPSKFAADLASFRATIERGP